MSETIVKKKRAPRIQDTAIITMQTDDNGVVYGKDNNPKRKDSKTYARFGAYHDGMTVKEAKEAGLTAGDIAYDRDHGYIAVKTVAVEEKQAA